MLPPDGLVQLLLLANRSEELLLPPSVSIAYRLIEEWYDRAGEGELAAVARTP